MNNLKFRVWHKREKKYYIVKELYFHFDGELGNITVWNNSSKSNESIFLASQVIIEQYTGLKDKNGEEIYEGDIIKTTLYGNPYGYIKWNDTNSSFQLRNVASSSMKHLTNYESIGNIHENNELLD